MYVSAISTRLSRGISTPAILAIVTRPHAHGACWRTHTCTVGAEFSFLTSDPRFFPSGGSTADPTFLRVPSSLPSAQKIHFYPWRCLCFGFSQITRRTPLRLISLHFLQIGLMDARTFIFLSPFVVKSACVMKPPPWCSRVTYYLKR
mgnify:CR=1 FL=1